METNQKIVERFFDAYIKNDIETIKEVMSEKVVWSFLGRHKLAGEMKGIEEVIAFFDRMSKVMQHSKPSVDKLIVASNENYLIECQHIITNIEEGVNINHHVCVLWTFEKGKIISGRHFFADPEAADNYFNAVG